MRIPALAAAAAVITLSAVAHADSADDLKKKGEAFAKQGKWSQAIAQFKAAEAMEHRTEFSCLIGLAYTRAGAWPQAELFLGRCEAQAIGGSALPSWFANAKQQLADAIAKDKSPAVTFEIKPAGLLADVRIDSFAADESLNQRPYQLHLVPGHYTVEVSVDGYTSQTREIDVAAAVDQTVSFDMKKLGATVTPPGGDTTTPPPGGDTTTPPTGGDTTTTKPTGGDTAIDLHTTTPVPVTSAKPAWPWIVTGASGGVLVFGVISHLVASGPKYDALQDCINLHQGYEGCGDPNKRFEFWRDAAIGSYVVGGVGLGVGLYFALRGGGAHHESAPTATTRFDGAVLPGGGMVTVEWELGGAGLR